MLGTDATLSLVNDSCRREVAGGKRWAQCRALQRAWPPAILAGDSSGLLGDAFEAIDAGLLQTPSAAEPSGISII